MVSIHAPRVGCDCGGGRRAIYAIPFQFTHPVWGATQSEHCTPCRSTFQFTHPVWGATQQSQVEGLIFPVSIHAPRVGCD